MKKFFPIFILVIAIIVISSCGKLEEIIETISESEAIEIIESSFQSNTGGLTSNLEDISEQFVSAITSGELCDSFYMQTIKKDQQGSQIQASYTSDLSYEITCNNLNIPKTATFASSTTSTYSTQRIVSDDKADFSGFVSGLQPSILTMSLEGKYKQNGTQDLDFMEQKNISSIIGIDLTELKINKQNYNIESGNGTFTFTGSTQDTNFSYIGNIDFDGNQTATITINGTSYQIDWK